MAQTHSRAVILSIGDELVLGQSLDTNSRWISERLLDRGVPSLRHVTVADEEAAIAAEIERGAADAELIVVSGGLGPTLDDLTRAALARAMGDELAEDAGALAQIRAWFDSRGRAMPPTNRVQALRPSRGGCLENTEGTAPGLRAEIGGADVFCLPGPPREMRPMFERFVVPALRPARTVRTRLLRTFGLGESRVAELLGDLMRRDRNPLVGTTASAGVVTVRMRWESVGGDGAAAEHGESELDQTEALVRESLGAAVFTPPGEDGERELAEVVLGLLGARRERVAVAESCTGGMLGAMITAVAGSSAVFSGGWIAYTNAMKAAHLGVPEDLFGEAVSGAPGAVSCEVARELALGALRRSRHAIGGPAGAEHALSITGIAGPEGGSEEKPVGTVWIGRASADGSVDCRRFLFGGGRHSVREWAAVTALGMLRLKLAGVDLMLQGEQERRSG